MISGCAEHAGALGRLDPRTRVAAAAAAAVLFAPLQRPAAAAAALTLALGLVASARLPAPALRARILGLHAVLLLVLPFAIAPGDGGVPWWAWARSAPAVTIWLKTHALLLSATALLGTLPPQDLGHALARMRMPARLVALWMMTVRYLGVLGAEWTRLRRAARARGFLPGTSLHTCRVLANGAAMLLVRSVQRAEHIARAMACRGFQGRFPVWAESRAGAADALFSAATLTGLAVTLWLEWGAA
jgi:cobalt/nickel transport system permease protein